MRLTILWLVLPAVCALPQTKPSLTVNPNSFTFTYSQCSGTAPAQQQLMVASTGAPAVQISFSVSVKSGAFVPGVSPTSGTTPATLNVYTAPSSFLDTMTPGTYNTTFSLIAPSAANQPTLTATLTIKPAGSSSTRPSATCPAATPLSITTTSLAPGLVNKAYAAMVAATGGTPPYTFSASGLPAGLSIDKNTGIISGNPTAAASNRQVSVTVADSKGATALKTFVLNILPFQVRIVSGDSQMIPAGSTVPLVIEADDANGNPMPNVQVQFLAPATGPSGTFAGGGNSTLITTGADGRATAQFTAGMATGGFSIAVTDALSGAFLAGFAETIVAAPSNPDQPSLIVSSGGSKTTLSPVNVSPADQKYWDGLGTGDASTNYFTQVPYIVQAPNPQIAAGPDDILTVANRTIARYPNPNGLGNPLVQNSQNNPPTESTPLATWVGPFTLGTLCPNSTDPGNCIVDNLTIRYDQMQGRFVALFTVTDLAAQTSNFALIVSNSASGFPSGQFFTTPLPGGSSGSSNWTIYPFSINVNAGAGTANYFPTGARIGLDNDNIILAAPVLDLSQQNSSVLGPYAGTRLVTIPKVTVYNQAPISTATSFAVNLSDNPSTGTITVTPSIPPIFWEPDNLRGRALASFDSQVNSSPAAGVITPIDYLVGTPITDDLGSGTSSSPVFYTYPIIFNCPAGALSPPPTSAPYCSAPDGTFSPSVPSLGTLSTISGFGPQVSDPALVPQSDANDGTSMANNPLFVGDSRPQQVIFREGFFYVARAVRPFDSAGNPFGASTVFYDIFRQPPTGPAAPLFNLYVQPANPAAGFGFFQPMFDVPANVPTSNSTSSPIDLTQLISNLKTDTTAVGNKHPSLWDFRPGDDAFDLTASYLDPFTGVVSQNSIPFGTRGGASTDPNDGSLWLFGEFAKNRASTTPGPGQWGTSVANFPLTFPAASYSDVPLNHPYFNWIQIAKNHGLVPSTSTTPTGLTFGPDAVPTRSEMAFWIVRAQMDEAQVNAFLTATGGIPGSSIPPSFSDAVLSDPFLRYTEVLYRRGYANGCGVTSTGAPMFCPNQPITFGEMAKLLIVAKLGNVYPSTANGISLPFTTPTGAPDSFGVPSSGSDPNSIYIQKMRELRIQSSGTSYSSTDPLTRKEVAQFLVRAFLL